jgi:hypothetical protein
VTTRPWFRPLVGLLFGALAALDVVWYLLNQPPDLSPVNLVDYLFELVPAVAAILLPAVLLVRHPDVGRRAPVLLLGTLLFALVQGLVILDGELQEVFATLTPPSADLPFLIPAATVFNILVSLTTAFGIGYIALGLAHSRIHDDRSRRSTAVTSAFVPVAAVFATVVGTVAVARIDFGDLPTSPTLIAYLAVSVVLGIIRLAVWAQLLAVTTRGGLAMEAPRGGWILGVAAAGLVIAALVLVNLGGILSLSDPTLSDAYGYAIVLAYGLGHIALFAAFAVGLPAFADEA